VDLGAAIIGLFIALVVKLAVMFLAARMLVRIYRSAYSAKPGKLWLLLPSENVAEVRVLWWALVFFALSELTCGIEIYILFQSWWVTSCSHSVASGIGMGLFALGMYFYFDTKFMKFGKSGCLAIRVCRTCTFEKQERCKFLTLLLLVATFVALAAIPPLFAPTDRMNADTRKFITPFESLNAWYDGVAVPWLQANVADYQPSGAAYFMPSSVFVIEYRVFPLIALALAALAILLLRARRELLGIKVLVFGVGMLCYTWFEVALYAVTGDVLIGSVAHEIVEFWFLVILAEFLRRAFPPAPDPQAVAVA